MRRSETRFLIVMLIFLACYPCLNMLYSAARPDKIYSFTEKFTIGIEQASAVKDEPYQFSTIISVCCDHEENILALDYRDKCVKKFNPDGIFVEKFFRQGKGPKEVANPFSISVNRHTKHLFVLQDYGFTLKEFTHSGEYVKYHVLPRQFFSEFHFLNLSTFVCRNSVPKKNNYDNFMVIDTAQKKVVKTFGPSNIPHELNHKQIFAVDGDSVLWTCRGDKMKLLAFDLNTGEKIREILIPGKYKDNKLLRTGSAQTGQMVRPILYNTAQPFIIDRSLFVFVIIQEYEKKNGEIDKYPSRWKRIIYQINGNDFIELGNLKDGEGFFVGTVSKNRLILYTNEPYGRLRVLEFMRPSM